MWQRAPELQGVVNHSNGMSDPSHRVEGSWTDGLSCVVALNTRHVCSSDADGSKVDCSLASAQILYFVVCAEAVPLRMGSCGRML